MLTITALAAVCLSLGPWKGQLNAAPPATDFEAAFAGTVKPFVQSYCVACHGGPQPMAQLDLTRFTSVAAVVDDFNHWSLVLEKLSAKQMPPPGAAQPPGEARRRVIDWIAALRREEALKHAGDPGIVLARRLSNAEYNYTIRDLTGVDMQPTREFPVDPANPAGFDNSGESLSMSPALLDKYLQAAREVADHMAMKPDGIAFAPHSMLVETDQDKYCVTQIIDFYRRQNTDFSAYFQAAWQFKHRAALGTPQAALADIAAARKVSPKYLATIWRTLEETKEEIGPTAKLQAMWRALPAPRGNQPDLAREGSDAMRDYVVKLRKKLEPRFEPIRIKGISRTAQPFLMWKNRQYATHRMAFDREALQVEGEAPPAETRLPAGNENAGNTDEDEGAEADGRGRIENDPDLRVPAGRRAQYEEAFERFSAVFPDAFYVSERGRDYLDTTKDRGRHLSAGFHNLMGYFRDDQPLYELILDKKQQQELDDLWRELDFVASAMHRTFIQFYLNESGEARGTSRESEGPRPADKEITSEPVVMQVREAYLSRARPIGNEVAIRAIEDHFAFVNETLRWVEKARAEAEPRHLEALLKFAARAYRRPLSEDKKEELLGFYGSVRKASGLDHAQAMRDALISVLMSPDFCYRIDLVEAAGSAAAPALGARRETAGLAGQPVPAAGAATAAPRGALPLSDYALASRLSYFLWASMPDEALLARAAAGELQNPEVLASEARRMLKDERVRGLAVEFGGNWLDFRRFGELNTVDRERFPSFTNELRQAMFEEPIELILDVIRRDRPVTELLYGKDTFVNPVLAKHYGMAEVIAKEGQWTHVEDATPHGRGGLLPMAAFLTQNAPGLRTSPVKRGYWVARRVLGETIPPPPAVVPELPRDEAKMDLPLRAMLARHREDPSCSSCHARFDSFGLAFEGYGPVGELRGKDLAGRPVDDRAEFPGGAEGAGLQGVQGYIRAHRENDFIENICRKMFVYALGRGLMLSDEPAIEEARAKLAANRNRPITLVEAIVTSPQFRTKRGPNFPGETNSE